MIGEDARFEDARFDLLWLSGFAHATMMGLPDAELALQERRLDMIGDIAARTTLPLLADGDTGGDLLACSLLCRRLESLGVSGVVLEDKRGFKRTSLANGVNHELEDPQRFADKINATKQALLSDDLLIFARTEALLAGAGLEEALSRTRHYLASRADGIVIHSKDKTGQEVFAYLDRYRAMEDEMGIYKPLICIPTAYSHVTAQQLHARGAGIVIYGNHMIRAAYRAMQQAAQTILKADRGQEADAESVSLSEMFDTLGTG